MTPTASSTAPVTGAESLLRAAAGAGIRICFANPGTTEMPLVGALDAVPEIRPVLGLFEGVCTGAADGWARITGTPALTLLHLGPGFGNGVANLHNARRARAPVVNLIGEHASWHKDAGAPLAMDIAGLAAPVSDWVRTSSSGAALGRDLAEAAAIAGGLPGKVATLIVAHDHQLEAVSVAQDALLQNEANQRGLPSVDSSAVDRAVRFLRDHGPAAIVLGDTGGTGAGMRAAGRIRAATGAFLVVETFSRKLERGGGLPEITRLPYFPEAAGELFSRFRGVLLAGAPDPVAFFGYPDVPSRMIPAGIPVETLAVPGQDIVHALEALAEALAAPAQSDPFTGTPPERPAGAITPATLSAAVAHAQPEGAIVLDEGITSVNPYFPMAAGCPPHSYLNVTGGSIGWGLPCATGCALAAPDRPVIILQGDGSALYCIQALWTQAREGLNVTTVVCSNRAYQILEVELKRAQLPIGPAAQSMMHLTGPALDWTQMARSFGAEAWKVERAEDLADTLREAVRRPGPKLIEAVMVRR